MCDVPGYFSASEYAGGQISLNQNGVSKAIIPSGFDEFEYCFQSDDIDIENDKIQLQLLDDNGTFDSVCIRSLYLNGKFINNFWLAEKAMCLDIHASPEITFRNGKTISSGCIGTYRTHILVVSSVPSVHLNCGRNWDF